jgi:multiple sugar transport system permease protein
MTAAADTSATAAPVARTRRTGSPRPHRGRRGVLYAFLTVMALAWLFPVLWSVLNSFRNYDYTSVHGYVSLGGFTFDNYVNAWKQGDFTQHFLNSLIITVPAVLVTLLLASCVAFVIARFSFWFNLPLLLMFTAANLLPQQALLVPLYRLYNDIQVPFWLSDSGTLYNSYWAVIITHIAFQTGFCTFVLSNYMKTLPGELTEAALVDGASVWRLYWQITLPLCKPAMAALATLLSIWIYNDFFWALVLISTGENMPITSALNNLSGQYFTDPNLVAAGALLTAIPTLVVYFVLQRQFVSGLTLGSNKG